jgi:hypothetical protein
LRPARLVFPLLLLGWCALLAAGLVDPSLAAPPEAAASTLPTALGLAARAGRALATALLASLAFAPLGALAVLALPDQPGRLRRASLVAVPAAALSGLLAWLALAVRAHAAPGRFEMALPALGLLFGVFAGLAWRRGWRARLLFLPKVAMVGIAALSLAGAVMLLALDAEPALPEPSAPTSAQKRELVALARGKDPRAIEPGGTRTLTLDPRQLDRLASWAASSSGTQVRTALALEPGGVRLTLSRRVPRSSRWLDVTASARAAVHDGRIAAEAVELRIGSFQVPGIVVDALVPLAVASLERDPDLRRLLAAVRELTFTEDAATLRYGRFSLPAGLVPRLVWGEESEAAGAMRAAVERQVDHLLAALEKAPKGDARFARALETAFAAARERSATGSPVVENRTELVALGVVLGHVQLVRVLGEPLDEARVRRARAVREATTLRGRDDWVRHFTVSGALTALSAVAPSDAIGLLKEELDADGGSGFSFGDLMADRSGTTFAEVATRDDASARRMQERLAAGFKLDDYFPPAADLPEGIPDAELQSRYGGVGGPLFRSTLAELERRLQGCAAYR